LPISNPGPEFDKVEFGVEIRNDDIMVILTRLFILSRLVSKLFSFDNFGRSYDQLNNAGLDFRIQIRHHNSA